MPVNRHLVHGLVVDSTVDLPGVTTAGLDGPADLMVDLAACEPVPLHPAEGPLVLEDRREASPVWVTEHHGGLWLRVAGMIDLELDPPGTRLQARPDPACPPGLTGLLTVGWGLPLVVTVRGGLVLHASAVVLGEVAVAVVAPRGGGKTSMASLLVAGGAHLLTDDTLRVDPGEPPRCSSGTIDLRLRSAAATFAPLAAPESGTRLSADGRVLARPDRLATGSPALAAVVVPILDRSARQVTVQHPPPAVGFAELVRNTRLTGWVQPAWRQLVFDQVATVVDAVPVAAVRIPWHAPPTPELAAEVTAAMTTVLDHRAGKA